MNKQEEIEGLVTVAANIGLILLKQVRLYEAGKISLDALSNIIESNLSINQSRFSESIARLRNEEAKIRFIPVGASEIGEESEEGCIWWLDQSRPLTDGKHPDQKYVAVQTEEGKDANEFVKVEGLTLLFNDAAEYYAVCPGCYSVHSGKQWTGHTRNVGNWRERSRKYLEKHQSEKGWCEFCDPVFGNGGWS